MNRHTLPPNRRKFLTLSIGVAATAAAGCRREAEISESAAGERSDVPLRLLLVGSAEDGEIVRRGWESVSELPLEVTVIGFDRREPAVMAEQVAQSATQTDVLLYPLAVVAELDARDAITPLSDQDYEQIEAETGQLYAALRSGAARYSAKFVGFPQGAPQPAVISTGALPDATANEADLSVNVFRDDSATPFLSWQQYDRWVGDQWKSSAAEPVAPGWAAAMYLWRAATNTSWLFDRENFQPLLAGDHYIQSLQQMVAANNAYQLDAVETLQTLEQRTPNNIWQAVVSGQLRGGIGFPGKRIEKENDAIRLGRLPQTSELPKVLLDPFSPIVSLSANCRQSNAAKRFIRWLSGGEGSDPVRRQVQGMTPLRPQVGGSAGGFASRADSGEPAAVSTLGDASYHRFLTEILSTPLTLPTLQILRGFEYYAALDKAILRALRGEVPPREALQQAATQWQSITEEVGAEKQLRWWRRAQGMRG